MTVETISGKCPCCGYDKMFMRYGSSGWTHWEGCPNCGFGYVQGDEEVSPKSWLNWAGAYVTDDDEMAEDLEVRKRLLKSAEETGRYNDMEGTIFKYSPEDIEAYKATNPIILNQVCDHSL